MQVMLVVSQIKIMTMTMTINQTMTMTMNQVWVKAQQKVSYKVLQIKYYRQWWHQNHHSHLCQIKQQMTIPMTMTQIYHILNGTIKNKMCCKNMNLFDKHFQNKFVWVVSVFVCLPLFWFLSLKNKLLKLYKI